MVHSPRPLTLMVYSPAPREVTFHFGAAVLLPKRRVLSPQAVGVVRNDGGSKVGSVLRAGLFTPAHVLRVAVEM